MDKFLLKFVVYEFVLQSMKTLFNINFFYMLNKIIVL